MPAAIHHVNLCVPEKIGARDGTAAEAEWLVDLLGYRKAEPGPDAAKFGALWWFEADDGHQVHLSVDPEHHPSGRAHTAIRLGDKLDGVIERLEAAGVTPRAMTFDGDRHVFASDPAGNLWELIGPPDA
jgi:catechol 2,3-dioxygenase-like lactoylglutathione lyase family enzyme